MSSRKKDKKRTSGEGFSIGGDENFSLTLGSILGKEGTGKEKHMERPKESRPSQEDPVKKGGESGISGLPSVSLQRQTAGRKGKTVTAVIIPRNSTVDREELAKEMRKGLGCGSFVEEGNVILQGDICERAADWLIKKGVKEVISGN